MLENYLSAFLVVLAAIFGTICLDSMKKSAQAGQLGFMILAAVGFFFNALSFISNLAFLLRQLP